MDESALLGNGRAISIVCRSQASQGWPNAPGPLRVEIEYEILADEETAKDHVYGVRRPTGKFTELKPGRLTNAKHAVAEFSKSADSLQKKDAEQAVEIMLRHAMRFEDVFFGRRTTWFAYYEIDEDRIYTAEQLLETIPCRLQAQWQTPQADHSV